MTHLNQTAFALACGILWGAGMLLLSVTAMLWGYGSAWVDLMGSIYFGAGAGSAVAVILSAAWAFVDGFIGGWLLAFLYNRFS